MSIDQKRLESILSQVRVNVDSLLEEGNTPPDITFALAYVATELGLSVAEEPVSVFPVVLSAVSQAVADRYAESDGANSSSDSIEVAQSSSLIH